MLRWAPGFVIAAVIAVLLGLLETLVAATGREKILLLLFFGAFPVTSLADQHLHRQGREGRAC